MSNSKESDSRQHRFDRDNGFKCKCGMTLREFVIQKNARGVENLPICKKVGEERK